MRRYSLWFSTIFCRLSIPDEKENENEERVRFGVPHYGRHCFEIIVRGACAEREAVPLPGKASSPRRAKN
jgi:hypothetical protein